MLSYNTESLESIVGMPLMAVRGVLLWFGRRWPVLLHPGYAARVSSQQVPSHIRLPYCFICISTMRESLGVSTSTSLYRSMVTEDSLYPCVLLARPICESIVWIVTNNESGLLTFVPRWPRLARRSACNVFLSKPSDVSPPRGNRKETCPGVRMKSIRSRLG